MHRSLLLFALTTTLVAQQEPAPPPAAGRAIQEGPILAQLFQMRVSRIQQSMGFSEDRARAMAERCWPGAVTLVLPARGPLARVLQGEGSSLGLRIPACPGALELLRRSGPLATTSANRSSEPPCRTAAEAAALFPALPLLGPGSEEDKCARLKPLMEQFLALRQQQDEAKRRFEGDILQSLSTAQQARMILLMEDIQSRIRQTLRENRLGNRN